MISSFSYTDLTGLFIKQVEQSCTTNFLQPEMIFVKIHRRRCVYGYYKIKLRLADHLHKNSRNRKKVTIRDYYIIKRNI